MSLGTYVARTLDKHYGSFSRSASAMLLGRFRQIEDLLRVKGIGRATPRKLRPLV